jgi:putative phage-type endonuclease
MEIKGLIQGSESWHAFRKGKIGASLVPAICGVCPFRSPLDAYNEIKGLSIQKPTESMKRGSELESVALSLIERKRGTLFASGPVFQHDSFSWAIASLDAVNFSRTELIEIKNPGRASFEKMRHSIPINYQYQIHWQMLVSRIEVAWFCGHFDGELVEHLLDWSDSMQCKIFEQVSDFYENHILRDVPPKDRNEPEYLGNADFLEKNKKYFQAYQQLNFWKKEMDGLKNQVLEHYEGLPIKGSHIAIRGQTRRGSLDEGKMLSDGIDIEKYRKPESVFPVISILKTPSDD